MSLKEREDAVRAIINLRSVLREHGVEFEKRDLGYMTVSELQAHRSELEKLRSDATAATA